MRRTTCLAFLAAGLILPTTGGPGADPTAEERTTFAWALGSWEGSRRDSRDGSEAPVELRVESILGGSGLAEHLVVDPNGEIYRGYAVQVFDTRLRRHVRQYVNATRGSFVRLEGEVAGLRSVWRSVAPQRRRESRLVSEHLPPNRWRRIQSISEDGGKTWRVLWVDELRRIGEAP